MVYIHIVKNAGKFYNCVKKTRAEWCVLMPLLLYEGVCLLRYFPIDSPIDGRELRIYYDSKDDKNELLQEVILNYWEDYCNEHWIWLGKFDEYQWNYEDKVKRFLNRCANFLLIGEYKKNDILSGNDVKRIIANEYSLEGDWENKDIEIELEETIDYLKQYVKQVDSGDGKILKDKFDNPPIKSRKKSESKLTKISKIFSKPDKEIEVYKQIHISNTFSVWDKVKKIVRGRKGLINPNEPYMAKWCIVNTNNEFEFNNNKYQINKSVKQYDIRMPPKIKHDDFKNDYQMDKILVYEQDDNIYFFDQNINRIDNEFIKKI